MKQNRIRPLIPLLLIFLAVNAVAMNGTFLNKKWELDKDVLLIGNLIIFIAVILSYFISIRNPNNKNAQSVVRSVYGSTMLKLMICIIAAVAYIILSEGNVNKPALFFCMGLYLVYTFVEVSIVTRVLKESKNV